MSRRLRLFNENQFVNALQLRQNLQSDILLFVYVYKHKKLYFFFKKPIDICGIMCYNMDTRLIERSTARINKPNKERKNKNVC